MAKRRKSPSGGAPAPHRAGVALPALLIVVAGVLAYANSLHGPFVLDDGEAIVTNAQIRQLWPPSAVLFPARELPVAGRPVVNVTFAMNYALGGLSVVGYHIVNIAIHILCALVLFGLVRRTLMLPAVAQRLSGAAAGGGDGPRRADGRSEVFGAVALIPLAVALIWLVHPLQTEAVDYLTQRTELLMGLFYLLTLYACLRALERPRWTVVAVVACLLGMGSKESMATVPLMVWLYDRAFVYGSFRQAWRARSRLYLALASTWILLGALMWSGPRSLSTGFDTKVRPWTYLLNQTVLIVHYLRLTIWPRGLVIDYGVPRQLTMGDVWPYFVLLTALAVLTAIALVSRPKLGFLGAWFFVTLAPTSSIVPIATWVGAERRMYLPLAALVVLAVLGASYVGVRLKPDATTRTPDRAMSKPGPPTRGPASRSALPAWSGASGFDRTAAIVLTMLVVALGLGTLQRNGEYRSAERLARTVIARWPHGRAHHWLATELLAQGRREEAARELRLALADEPRAHYTIGLMAFQDKKYDEAIANLNAFIQAEPLRIEVVSAREMIAKSLAAQGRFPEAEQQLRRVLAMVPSEVEAHAYLGDVLLNEGRFADAVTEYQEFLRHRPATVGLLLNLGIAFTQTNRLDDAVAMFRQATELDPQNGGAERNLARALLDQRKFTDALPAAEAAVRLRPDDAEAHDNLGLALAGTGRLADAIVEFRRSVTLNPGDSDAAAHLAEAERADRSGKEAIIGRP